MQKKIKIFLASIIITSLIIIPSIFISIEYYKLNPFFYDPGDFLTENYLIYLKINSKSFIEAFTETLLYSNDPFRKCLTMIISPSLLLNKYSHLISSFIAIQIFCYCAINYTYSYSKNLLYSITLMLFIFIFSVIYDPFWGISAYWLDLTASFLLCSSIFCLLFFEKHQNKNYLVAFSILLSFSILSRYIFIVYSIWILFPIFLIIIYRKYKNKKYDEIKSIIITPFIIISVIAGSYIALNFFNQFNRYTSIGYALNHPWKDSVYSYFWFLRDIITFKDLILIFVLSVFYFFHIRKKMSLLKFEIFISTWLIISTPIFLIFFIKSYNAYHANLIIIPLIISALIIIFSVCKQPKNKVYYLTIIFFSLLNVSYVSFNKIKNINSKKINNTKELYINLISNIDMKNSKKSFGNAVFPFSKMIKLEYLFNNDEIPETIIDDIYDFKDIYYSNNYPQLEIKEIIKIKKNELDQYDELLIYADTNEVKSLKYIEKEISLPVAISNIKYISSNKNWLKTHTFNTKEFGKLHIYKKILD